MRKKYTRIHAVIFATVIILSAMPLTVFSAEPEEEGQVIRTEDSAGQERDLFSGDGILLPETGISEAGEQESAGEGKDAFDAGEQESAGEETDAFAVGEQESAGEEKDAFAVGEQESAVEEAGAFAAGEQESAVEETGAFAAGEQESTGEEKDAFAAGEQESAVEETGAFDAAEEPAASEADLIEEEEYSRELFTDEELTLSAQDYVPGSGSVIVEPTVDEIAEIEAVSLFLTDKIGLQVHVALNNEYISEDKDFLAFTCAGRRVEQLVSETYIDDQGSAVFTLDLTARQMTDEVTLQMNVGGTDGTPVNCSVRSYADAVLAGTEYTEQEKEMVRAMLNYGSYTQLYAGYNTDSLAAAGLYAEGEDPVLSGADPDLTEYAYSYELNDQEDGLQVGKASLLLGTDISIRFYYQLGAEKTADDYSFFLEGYLENEMTMGYDQEKDMYYAEIEHISPVNLGRMYTLVICEAPEPDFDNPIATVTFGVLSYCRGMIENGDASDASRNLSRAIYNYYEAASAF